MHLVYKPDTLPRSLRVSNGNRRLTHTTPFFKSFELQTFYMINKHHTNAHAQIWDYSRLSKYDFYRIFPT